MDFLDRLASGNWSAFEAFYSSQFDRLCRKIASKLNQRVAARLDPEDIAQSTFRSFWRRTSQGQYRFESDQKAWNLLVTIAVHKTINRMKRETAAKRDVRLERGLDVVLAQTDWDAGIDAAVEILDECEVQLSKDHARLLLLTLSGASSPSAADQLQVTRSMANVMWKRIEDLLSKTALDDSV